jgi:adenine-specific DNA-methyltransferase
LINLLVQQEREKAFGLVWERKAQQGDPDSNDLVLARIDIGLSERSSPWVNMVIEADNIDALRWLRISHRGRIKCIYIDPPFNTGSKGWVYDDDYTDKEDRYRHSTWLEFLYRRMTLARDLLAEDGVLLVSINDDQRAKLEMLMDVALPGMRMGSFVWRTRAGGNDTKGPFLSDNHEHVLVYGKPAFRFSGTEKMFESYRHWDEKKTDYYQSGGDLTKAHNRVERPNTYYPLHDPACDVWYPCNPDSVWRFSSKVYGVEGARIRTRYIEELISDNYIDFPTDQRVAVWTSLDELLAAIRSGDVPSSGNARFLREDTPNLEFWVGKRVGFGSPSLKRYKKELKSPTQPLSSWITPNFEVETVPSGDTNEIVAGTSIEAARSIKSIFGEKAFNYAKPVSLIRELVRQSTGPGDTVLDFFAGSATTAHAVMELNAEDGMDRRFIIVSSTEATDDGPGKNLCRDVTAERIRKLNASTDPKYDGLVAGFAYLRTERIPMEHLDLTLDPAIAWTSLEALHGLPLTPYDPDLPWNSHETVEFTLVLVDRFEPALIEWLGTRLSPPHVYTWAMGRFREHLVSPGLQVSLVVQTLEDAFNS